MIIALVIAYVLSHFVHFSGLVAELIQFQYPDGKVLKLYGPFLVAFQIYVFFKNYAFFVTEFGFHPGFYSLPWVLATETGLHALFILFYTRLVTRIIPRHPRFWKPLPVLATALIPLPFILLTQGFFPGLLPVGQETVRLISAVSTSLILLYSGLYFIKFRKGIVDPPCANPMMLFTALGNFIFIPLFLTVQVIKTVKGDIPYYLFPENLYLLSVGMANLCYDTPKVFSRVFSPNPTEKKFPDLTPREWEIIEFIERGLGNKQIAAELNLSENTIRNHIHELFKRCSVKNRVQLMIILKRHRGTLL